MTEKHRRMLTALGLLFLLPFTSAAKDLAPWNAMLDAAGFPEHDETRRALASLIRAEIYPVPDEPFTIHRQVSDGRLVRFEVRKTATDWYLIFRSQRSPESKENYPAWGRGVWNIKKSLMTGEYIQAKIFLQDDPDSFVRLFPRSDGRSVLDVHFYGRRLGNDVLLPAPFEDLMLAPFAKLMALSERSVDWSLIFPDPDAVGYERAAELVDLLLPYGRRIDEVADAAVDGVGRNVYIETRRPVKVGAPLADGGTLEPGRTGLNCSGYVKWVADGIYAAWSGRPGELHLELEPLLRPAGRSARNPWNDARSALDDDARSALEILLRDPYFGLDWTRNLARLVEEARLGRGITEAEAAVLDAGELPGLPYRKDMGYLLEDLDAALYMLAAKRPGSLWLAAVNSRFVPEPGAGRPNPLPLHQYWHVALLIPWFDDGSVGGERGRFRVAVLDVGEKQDLLTDLTLSGEPIFPGKIRRLALRYAALGSHEGDTQQPEVLVNLVRVDIPGNFKAAFLPEAR